jgi:hypothetical protein
MVPYIQEELLEQTFVVLAAEFRSRNPLNSQSRQAAFLHEQDLAILLQTAYLLPLIHLASQDLLADIRKVFAHLAFPLQAAHTEDKMPDS